MNKFVKKSTTAELDINGELFQLDFGRDEILPITLGAAKELQDLEDKYKDVLKLAENASIWQSEQKAVFKKTINELFKDDTAAQRIFHEDDTGLYHSAVYDFIVEQIGVLRTENTKYSAERVKK